MTDDARALLRAAQEVHVERHGAQTFTLGTYLPLEAAAQRIGIRPDRFRYYDAVKELEYEAAIKWDPSARYAKWDKIYIITQRGPAFTSEVLMKDVRATSWLLTSS